MDEDNQEQIKFPVREIDDEKVADDLKKFKAKKAQEETKEGFEKYEKVEKVEAKPVHIEEDDEEEQGYSTQKMIQQKVQEKKQQYQEMAKKIELEKLEREKRLEDLKTQNELRNPNAKGALVKDLSVIAIVVSILLGIGLLFSGNFSVAIATIVIGGICGIMCLALSEMVKLLQLIYDLLYFERHGDKK